MAEQTKTKAMTTDDDTSKTCTNPKKKTKIWRSVTHSTLFGSLGSEVQKHTCNYRLSPQVSPQITNANLPDCNFNVRSTRSPGTLLSLPCGPKTIFSIDHHYKRDVRKTVDGTPGAANKVNYNDFYYEFLSHVRFYIGKTFLKLRKVI